MIPLEEQAIRLSPQDRAIAGWYGRIGMAHLLQRRADDAIHWLEKARSRYAADGREPVYVHSWLASAYALAGQDAAARAEFEAGLRARPAPEHQRAVGRPLVPQPEDPRAGRSHLLPRPAQSRHAGGE